jgi:hypothetical protein
MGWKFPKHRIRSGDPLGIDEFNENAIEFASESGHLNEHNWGNGIINSESLIDKGARIKARARQKSNGYGGDGNSDAANASLLSAVSSWVVVPDFNSSFATPGGLLLIIISIQQDGRSNGIMWAISINGQIIPESILGTGELSNDRLSFDALDPATGFAPAGFPSQSSPGIQRARIGITTQVVIPVLAGIYTIQLLAYQLEGDWGSPQYVPVGEIITLELLR